MTDHHGRVAGNEEIRIKSFDRFSQVGKGFVDRVMLELQKFTGDRITEFSAGEIGDIFEIRQGNVFRIEKIEIFFRKSFSELFTALRTIAGKREHIVKKHSVKLF